MPMGFNKPEITKDAKMQIKIILKSPALKGEIDMLMVQLTFSELQKYPYNEYLVLKW